MRKKFVLEIFEYGNLVRKMEDSDYKRFMAEVERIMIDHLKNSCRQQDTTGSREEEVKNVQFHIHTFQ
jgi:hypothetical protein